MLNAREPGPTVLPEEARIVRLSNVRTSRKMEDVLFFQNVLRCGKYHSIYELKDNVGGRRGTKQETSYLEGGPFGIDSRLLLRCFVGCPSRALLYEGWSGKQGVDLA